MKPCFLITMPRAGGTALARMLGIEREECSAAVLDAAKDVEMPKLLDGRGWRSLRYGVANWKNAILRWSWLLTNFPGVPVVLLTRHHDPDGRYELSLMGSLKKWVPSYGECFGGVFTKTRNQLRWMEDFNAMNPARTILLDHADLGDYETLATKLGDLAPSFEAWQAQALERPQSTIAEEDRPDPNPAAFEGWETFDFMANLWEGYTPKPWPEADSTPDFGMEGPDEDEDPFGGQLAPARIHIRRSPRPFIEAFPEAPRAIVYPWLSTAAVWHELRYSLRSVHEHFEDRECPIYILGDAPPPWLKPGGRVIWRAIQGYAPDLRGKPLDRRSGMWQATVTGVQLADEVCWMNDDICFLRDTGWDDLRVALNEGRLEPLVPKMLESSNVWQKGLARAVLDLQDLHPHQKVWRFATHTPFLFERAKSLEVLRTYRLAYKGSWVTLYHNHHQTPHVRSKGHKTHKLPGVEGARFLNYNNHSLNENLREAMEERFPDPAPWEVT